jgi:hypothetical protein
MEEISTGHLKQNHDIYDDDTDADYSFPFMKVLHDIDSVIIPSFRRWDGSAISYQKYRQMLLWVAIFAGILSVIAIIPETHTLLPAGVALFIQNLAAFIVFFSILIGIKLNFQQKWLLFRHKSELLRLLKFHILLDPEIFSQKRDVLLETLKRHVHDVDAISQANLSEFIKDEFKFWDYAKKTPDSTDQRFFMDLVTYYREKRIRTQVRYFEERARYREKIDSSTRHLPKITNIIGITFLGLFFLLSVLYKNPAGILSFLVVLAAVLPAVGASIKSYRTTNEIARIASLYRTRLNKLSTIEKELQDGLEGERIDMHHEMNLLRECERILKDEHHEWLRLMIQSEWVT